MKKSTEINEMRACLRVSSFFLYFFNYFFKIFFYFFLDVEKTSKNTRS